MKLLCEILHYRSVAIDQIQHISLTLMRDLVAVADKYDCVQSVNTPLINRRLAELTKHKSIQCAAQLVALSYTLGNYDVFHELGQFLVDNAINHASADADPILESFLPKVVLGEYSLAHTDMC